MSSFISRLLVRLYVGVAEDVPDASKNTVTGATVAAIDKCATPPKHSIEVLNLPADIGNFIMPDVEPSCMKAELDAHVKPLLIPPTASPTSDKTR